MVVASMAFGPYRFFEKVNINEADWFTLQSAKAHIIVTSQYDLSAKQRKGDSMDISGATALVTGGGSGLGEATARLLADKGARVAILDLDADRAETVAKSIDGVSIPVDVSDAKAVELAVKSAAELLAGAPRIVVNCAGVGLAARVVGRESKLSIDVFEKTININLLGTYNVMSHASNMMMALDPLDNGERGVIVNTSSVAWQDGQIGQSAYSASKGAIAAMTLPVAREFAQAAIRVMSIAPGLFSTPMMQGLPEEVTTKIASEVPFPKRLGDPNEFAMLVAHIAQNQYLNGTNIRLDGAVRLAPK